jgi:leader peptidase (prepilin peptidase)/N-methyltransferase
LAGGVGVILDPLWRRLAAGLPAGRWTAAPVDPPLVLGPSVGGLAALLVAAAGPPAAALAAAALAPLVVLASAIDLRWHRLPDRLTGTATAVLAAVALLSGDGSVPGRAAAGAALFAGVLLVVHLVSPAGMGFGDVKLGVPLGFAVGATGVVDVMVALVLALTIGAVAGLVVLARHRDRSRAFAFGPCLCAGAVLALLL